MSAPDVPAMLAVSPEEQVKSTPEQKESLPPLGSPQCLLLTKFNAVPVDKGHTKR